MARHVIVPATVLAVLAFASAAGAVEFDAAGNPVFDPRAAWTLGFEPGDATLPEAGAPDAGDASADGGAADNLDIVDDAGALEGGRILRVPQYQGINIPVTLPSEGRSYRVSLWARGEVIATFEASYGEERIDEFGSLYPTGRMTSDGWYELETHAFSFDAARAKYVQVGFFSPAGADVDAIEIVADGSAAVGAACAGAGDKSSCGPDQLCQWGECRNMGPRVPPLPPPDYREQLVSYLQGRFRNLFGPFKNRRLDLPNALAELDAMRGAGDGWSFWRHFYAAVHRLHDWHTQSTDLAGFVLENPKPISVCFIEGVGDASDATMPSDPFYADVLVSHVGSVGTLGLHAGDRLVSVDGEHPIAWARSLIGVDNDFWTASNHNTHAEDVSRLASLVARFADHIEVVRCSSVDGTCAAKRETISISDLAASPAGTRPDVSCDNRPLEHVPGAPPGHSRGGFYSGIVDESNQTEAIYGLQWSSLYVTGQGDQSDVGPKLDQAVATWRQSARGVILDHRTGFGGTSAGPAIIWNFVRKPVKLDIFLYRQRSDDEGPQTLAEGKSLFDALVAQAESAGSANPALDVPVALLTHLDGSASDWLPLGIKGAPLARIFAPYETAGGFSTRFQLGYWLGLGYSIAVGDTVDATGQMLNGTGVAPDVVVAQKQSDLLAGYDTAYDAAIAWVRQELKP